MKRTRKPANNFKSKPLPQCDGAFVRAHHKIELHGVESALAGAIEGVRAHRPSYASTGCPGSGDVSAIGYMRAAALLIGLQEVRAYELGVLFRDENLVQGSKPILECVLAPHIPRQRVRLAGTNGRLENRPNRIGVDMRGSGADLHTALSQGAMYYVNLTH